VSRSERELSNFNSNANDNADAEDRFIERELEILKITSTVRNNIIRGERYRTADFLLHALRAILEEQVQIRQLRRDVADYCYSALRDQALQKRYID
jgi:hypothetical protein